MRKLLVLGVTGAAITLLAFYGRSTAGEEAGFKVDPGEYRSWNHVKSMVIFGKDHPLYNPFWGIHHVYVNDRGLATVKKTGRRRFPDGTVLAVVFYEHRPADGNTAYVEGLKRIEAFMVKDSKRYKETDGWGYYAYDGKGRSLVKDMVRDCHSCHSQVRDRDFVFSVWTR